MRIIASVNNKGGVGKTTVSKLLAEYFSLLKGKRVLAIDCDHQCNFSNRFVKMEIDPTDQEGKLPPIHPDYEPKDYTSNNYDGRSNIADIFFGLPVLPYSTSIDNLDIIPAHSSKLLLAEAVRKVEVAEKVHNQLYKFLNLEEVKSLYDIVIIDTPPSKGPLTISVVRAATDIVIPSVMEPQAIEGIYGMLQLWRQEQFRRGISNPLNLMGILPNMFKKNSNLHEGYLKTLKNNTAISRYVIDAILGRRLIFAEVDADGAKPTSIFHLPDNNQAKQEAILACKLIEERMSSE